MQHREGGRMIVDEISATDMTNPLPKLIQVDGDEAAALAPFNGNFKVPGPQDMMLDFNQAQAVDLGPHGTSITPGKPYAVYELASPHPIALLAADFASRSRELRPRRSRHRSAAAQFL